MLGVVVAFSLAAGVGVAAQQEKPKIKPSQHGSVSQRINDTTITVVYNRPVARGRELFGKLVPVRTHLVPGRRRCDDGGGVDGGEHRRQELPAGKYSLWTEPQAERWTVIFNKNHRLAYPISGRAGRAAPAGHAARRHPHGNHGVLFPGGRRPEGELAFHWGTVVVPLTIEVP